MCLSVSSVWAAAPTSAREATRPVTLNLLRDALHLRYDLFGDVARCRVVALEVHGRGRAPLRHGAQVGRVAEHLRERDVGRDDLRAARTRLHLLYLHAAAVQVAVDRAHVLLGRDDLDAHDGFEQDGLGLLHRVLERERPGDVERALVGVDLVVRAEDELDLDVHQLVAGEEAALHRVADALLDGLDELARDGAARDLVLEDEALARRGRDLQLGVAVLAPAARLALVALDALGRLRDGLAVGDLRLADVGLDAELALHAVDDNFEVQLAHAGDDGLAGLLVGRDVEAGVFLRQARERRAELVLVGAGLGLNGDADDGRRELHRLKDDGLVLVAHSVAGRDLLHAADGDDLAGGRLVDVLALVGVHPQQAPHPLLRPLDGVVGVGAAADGARVDADERELAEVLVGHDLEDEAGERRARFGGARFGVARPRVHALDGRDVERARQVVDDRVQERLHALVLEGGAGDDGDELDGDGALAERRANLRLGKRSALVFEVLLHQLLVGLGGGFEQPVAHLLRAPLEVFGNVGRLVLRALRLVVPQERLHRDEIDDALELVFEADGNLQGDGVRAEAVDDRLERAVERGSGAVELVDEADARDAVLVGLTPDGLGLRLDARDAVEHGDRAVEDAKAALDLHREVHVAGRVDDVDAVLRPGALPEAGRRGRGDRDAALLLLLHPVHRRSALVHLADLVRDARVEEHALGRGGLTGIDVRHDADVPELVQVLLSHDSFQF